MEIRTLRNLGAQVNVLLGVLQEVDKLHDFDLGLLAASNVPVKDYWDAN